VFDMVRPVVVEWMARRTRDDLSAFVERRRESGARSIGKRWSRAKQRLSCLSFNDLFSHLTYLHDMAPPTSTLPKNVQDLLDSMPRTSTPEPRTSSGSPSADSLFFSPTPLIADRIPARVFAS
jgi:hypothetical protein